MKTLLEFDHKKAAQAINFLAKKEGGTIGKLKLIKLTYLADRYHLRRYGRPIFNDVYIAMKYGAVGSSVKDIAEFSDFLDVKEREYAEKYLNPSAPKNNVVSIADVDVDVFSKSELEALEFAYNQFGECSVSKLVDISHAYPEWRKFKSILESEETTRCEPMSYSDFFKNPENDAEDKLVLPSDMLEASKELFEDDYRVARYWK